MRTWVFSTHSEFFNSSIRKSGPYKNFDFIFSFFSSEDIDILFEPACNNVNMLFRGSFYDLPAFFNSLFNRFLYLFLKKCKFSFEFRNSFDLDRD
jgi:hypothetical protein